MRTLSLIRSLFLTLTSILGGLCLIVFACAAVLGASPAIVISGSMSPTIPVGSLTFAMPTPAEQVRVGDVVMVDRPDGQGLVTHRVVRTEPADGMSGGMSLVLKGDANSTDDPVPYLVTEVGKVVTHVPYLGNVASFLQTRLGLAAIALVAVAFVVAFVLDPARARGRSRDDRDDEEDAPGGGTRGGARQRGAHRAEATATPATTADEGPTTDAAAASITPAGDAGALPTRRSRYAR